MIKNNIFVSSIFYTIKFTFISLRDIIIKSIFERFLLMNTVQYIIKRLEELGVNDFFGFPDDYNTNLIYDIENNQNTHWIGCTNPLNAGYAADGYARIRGYGALVTSFGAGELSAINAIAGAMAENVPIFHISGLPSTDLINNKNLIHHNFQDADYQKCINAYQSVTAAAAFLTRENAKLEIDRLIKTMVREKRPVYAAIPEDIAQTEISDRVISYDWISDKKKLEEVAAKITEKIKKSKNPVILGDVLIKRFDAKIEFKEFVEKTGLPATNFIAGTNVINMDAQNYIGGYFGNNRNPIVKKYLEETDCLIAVGTIYSDINSFGQNLPFNINNHIAIYGNCVYIEGKRYDNVKMSDVLEAVTNMTETANITFNKSSIGIKFSDAGETKLTSSYLFARIQDFIKENDIIFTETGTSLFGSVQMKLPESVDFQIQTLWSSAGWATPAALGASLAKPQSRVLLISGEGAHQQTAIELGNMIRCGIKPVIIIINNKGYAAEQLFSNGLNNKISDVTQINYAKFARVFEGDVWATKVDTAEDFDKALRVTQIMNKLCYIEACIDSDDMPSASKEIIRTLKEKFHTAQNKELTSDNVSGSIDDVILQASEEGMEYETVVHKVFSEESNEEQQNG